LTVDISSYRRRGDSTSTANKYEIAGKSVQNRQIQRTQEIKFAKSEKSSFSSSECLDIVKHVIH